MKLVFLLIFAISFSLSANIFSQDQALTLRTKNMTLHDLFKEIEKQSNYRFFYNDELVGVNKTVSIDVEGQSIDQVLGKLLANTDLKYRRMENNLIVVSSAALLQQITVTGTVTGGGELMPGVNVTVKGTLTGVVTDINGKYSITVPNSEAVLVFSFVGYTTTEMQVGSQRSINIDLPEDTKTIEEVVVVGYGTQRKSDLTGSVVSVKGAELNQLPTMRPDAALQGRAAGVMIQNSDGAPGGNVNIRIRGGNSISASNKALVVVDGLQGADITLINPNDIESLEVLKDASATAIYGARGANGVIMITTKRGASGKPIFQYDYSIGFQKLANKIDIMSAGEYARDRNAYKASFDESSGVKITPILPFNDEHIAMFDRGENCTDWQDALYRTGVLQKHQLSVSGGGNNIKYFISAGYMDQTGILVNSDYQRYNLRVNLDAKLTKWLSTGVNLNMMKAAGNVPPVGEGTRYGDIMGQVINMLPRFDPCTPIYNEDGEYNFRARSGLVANSTTYADMDIWNPMATAMETYNLKNQYRQEANLYFDFTILPGLTFRIQGMASINNDDIVKYQGRKTSPGFGTGGLGNTDFSSSQYYQNSNILNYNKTFGDHRLQLTAAAEQSLDLYKSQYVSAQGFFSDDTGIKDLASASIINERSTDYTRRAINSWLGRINYAYKDRYMVTASIRRDGSSVFGANNKYGNFPSASVAWNIAEEDFMKVFDFLSQMKVRYSWGITGNQAISPYQTLATVASGANYPYLGTGSRQTGYRMSRPDNPSLKWETTTQNNLGFDLGFFSQRLTLTVDLYKKTTTDLLMSKQIPSYTGFTSATANVGSIENKGIEVTVAATPVATRDFRWSTDANISINRDKVLKLDKDTEGYKVLMNTNIGGGYGVSSGSAYTLKQLRVGRPVEQMYGWVCLGTWSTAEAEEARAYGRMPGDAKFLDVARRDNPEAAIRSKLVQATDGEEIIGNASPKFYYGWNNTLQYKNFNLQFMIQGAYGNDIFNATRIKLENPQFGTSGNLRNRWTSTNQNTFVPAYTSGWDRNLADVGTNKMTASDTRTSRWIEDGSYVRLKYVTLSMFLPQSLISSWPIDKLAVYVSGSNLVTITDYTGYDPEVSSFNARGTGGLGIDMSNYPTARVFTIGLNVTF